MTSETIRISVVDSHTGGEPTRVVLEGSLSIEGDTMDARRNHFSHAFDHLHRGIVREPRGSAVWVGALLTAPITEHSICGVIFFNDAGMLGMCGHGTIGLVETLRHLGRIEPGPMSIDTPVGTIQATLLESGEVAVRNVPSRRTQKGVSLAVPGFGDVIGDVAYGGNWFFLVQDPLFEISIACEASLSELCTKIRLELVRSGICGDDGSEIDHVELFGSASEGADSINFVQCPGGAYDRSPCGTGTSAKLAGLFADGKLRAGEEYRQMGVTGSVFRGSVEPVEGGVIPTIVGRAFVTAESTLIFSENDPLRWGVAY